MKKFTLLATSIIPIMAIVVVSCEKDDELNEFNYDLDVNSNVTLTKSVQSPPYETGATQTLGGTDKYSIPIYEDECMMYAMISIAKQKKSTITYLEQNSMGGYKEKHGKIGNVSASVIYEGVKNVASVGEWSPYDNKGNVTPVDQTNHYSGGEMLPSMACEVGKKSGILDGKQIYFSSYEEMENYIKNPTFQINHPAGTYIICSDSEAHATIGKGIDRNGNIKYSDATHSNSKYSLSQRVGSWSIIY